MKENANEKTGEGHGKLQSLVECPVCDGSGTWYHRTYGTGKRCEFCFGRGKVRQQKIKDALS